MSREELETLRNSSEAPYDHREYTVWLHNKIIYAIQYELWNFREMKVDKIKSSYVACNKIISLPSLKTIKNE